MTADLRTLTIRQMTASDVGPLATALGWPTRGIESRYKEQAEGKREVLVAVVEGTPIGSVSINVRPDVPGLTHLFALDVAPAFHRRGIGTALIGAVERSARARRLDGVWLDVAVDNMDAMRLYERLGYRRCAAVVNRWSHLDEHGVQKEVAEMCYRMFKRFNRAASANVQP